MSATALDANHSVSSGQQHHKACKLRQCVRNLGIYIDSDMSMKMHVSKTVSCCFNSLRQIRSIQHSVSRPVLLSLVTSLVLTRLDYGSATLAGVCGRVLDRLQSVLNAAARSFVIVGSTTTSYHCFAICTGCESLTESSFAWPSSCSSVAATPPQHICPETCTGRRTATLGDDFVRHHLTSW